MTAPIPIRMSSAGKCPRQLYYAAYQTPESDPPDRQSKNRMALGDAAENLLIYNMIEDGWEITDTRAVPGGEQIELEIAQPIPMTGHPDGICRHPEYTKNRWVTLECKSMSTQQIQRVRSQGIAAIYPDYLSQVTCYARTLFEQKRVVHPHKAVFVYMDRDGDNPPPERISWTADHEDSLWHRLVRTWRSIVNRDIPDRPYAPDDTHCQYCPFYTLCQGQSPPDWQRPVDVHDPDLIEAAQAWQSSNEQRSTARDFIKHAVPDPFSPGISVGPLQASWFWPKDRDTYDPDLLEQEIPMDILRRCLNTNAKGPAFWIRPKRR